MIYIVDVADMYYPSGGGEDWVLVTRDLESAKARAESEKSRYHIVSIISINEDNLHAHTVEIR